MPKKLYYLLSVLSVLFLLALAALLFAYRREKAAPRPAELSVAFLDVGQGDVIYAKSPYGQDILIDGGPDRSVAGELAQFMDFGDKTIDLMILTHPHDDHVTGLIEILKKYEVKKILYTGVLHTAPNFFAWLEAVKEAKTPLAIIAGSQTIDLGPDCRLQIVYPLSSLAGRSVANLNNTSIALRLVYKEKSFFLPGDMEKEEEVEILKNKATIKADVLKVAHHASDTSSAADFLAAVSPELAVIEVGRGNKYGFPSRRVLKRLERAGAKIYATDLNGNIQITTDGRTLHLEAEK